MVDFSLSRLKEKIVPKNNRDV